MKKRARLKWWAPGLAAVAIPAAALAQSSQAVTREAENLYTQAAGAMIKKDYATACPKFEQVTRLVPDGGGARLNLAQCHEEWGKLASAFRHYMIAGELAKKDGRKDRQQTAAKGAARLKPKIATLTVSLPESVRSAPDLAIKLDGEVLDEKQWGAPYPIDKGAHTLVATARGYEPRVVHVDIEQDGTRKTASIPPLERERARPEATASPSAAPSAQPEVVIVKEQGVFTSQVRTAAVIGGGTLALGGIVAGGVLLGVSVARNEEWQKAVRDPYGRDAAKAAAEGEAGAQSAAIWCFVGGGVAAAGTAVFYLVTRPRAKAPVTAGAIVGPAGPSIWVQGQF